MRRQRVSLSRFVSPGFKPAERIMGLPRERIGRPAGPGMTSDPQVQPNGPGQDGWLMALAMPIIGSYGPKYAARQSLEISWDESDATSPSLKSQDGAGGGGVSFLSSARQPKCSACSAATALTLFLTAISQLSSIPLTPSVFLAQRNFDHKALEKQDFEPNSDLTYSGIIQD